MLSKPPEPQEGSGTNVKILDFCNPAFLHYSSHISSNFVTISSDSNVPECPFAHSYSGTASCSFSSETRGTALGSTEFVTIMSTYILLLVVPAQSSAGYGSEMNCPLKTMPALSSPTRIIKNRSPRRASSHS